MFTLTREPVALEALVTLAGVLVVEIHAGRVLVARVALAAVVNACQNIGTINFIKRVKYYVSY